MTQPRCVLPGKTVMITRRTIGQYHLFRPDREMNQLYLYCLAICANKFGLEVHCPGLMSNHEHIIATDVHGNHPAFTNEFHRLVALGVQKLRRWDGPVWDHRRPNIVVLETDQSILEKIVYTIVNPVDAGLVKRSSDWPGVKTLPSELGNKEYEIERPSFFFDPKNPRWPKKVTLRLTVPFALRVKYTCNELRQLIDTLVRSAENAARTRFRRTRGKKRSQLKLQRMSPFRRTSRSKRRSECVPQVAVGQGNKVTLLEALAQLKSFRQAYCLAIDQWKKGNKDVEFPLGTYWMQVFHKVRVVA